jgi:ATP-dependent protease HslVU (ClpYQ) peptidase subunit
MIVGAAPSCSPALAAKKAMGIAANSCVYTNHNFTWQRIKEDGSIDDGAVSQPT